ncbi:hypothetical protein [Acinetobacter wuhouensis]|uniref:Uncharacterized protein n=1 Tax=Acinetobacter wuhouensis TaxID=1879050 RepID=A0A3G2T3T1_9GAMM|nr:hypothetical protein [Acinetobacter wuhouensis]AYO54933.1 hypothetical protein CDG68_15300 [Acinetobacter wuhouensis]
MSTGFKLIIGVIIAVFFIVLGVGYFSDKQQKNNVSHSEAVPAPVADGHQRDQSTTLSDAVKLSPTEAKIFAENLLKKINDDEKFIEDAFELKEQNTLEKYFYDIQSYKFPNQDDSSKSFWVDADALAPYVKCSTALDDLQLYASALKNQLREDTATTRKIVRQEKEDYQKSKAQCEARVKLSYDQALAEDDAE